MLVNLIPTLQLATDQNKQNSKKKLISGNISNTKEHIVLQKMVGRRLNHLNRKEAVSHDRININKIWLENDLKSMTMTNLND